MKKVDKISCCLVEGTTLKEMNLAKLEMELIYKEQQKASGQNGLARAEKEQLPFLN